MCAGAYSEGFFIKQIMFIKQEFYLKNLKKQGNAETDNSL